jgi:hypothetical protein
MRVRRLHRPLALAAAAALSFGAVACDGDDDLLRDDDPAADPEDDPGLDETDEGTTEDPAGEDVTDG